MIDFDSYWKDFCYRQIQWWEDVYARKMKEGKKDFCDFLVHDSRSQFKQIIDFLKEQYLIEYVPVGLRSKCEREPLKQLEFGF